MKNWQSSASPVRTSPEESVLRVEHAEHVREALQQIPSQYRIVLVLHDMEELSTSEVAEVMGVREGTVRVRLHRARLALRKALAKQELRLSTSASQANAKPRRCREIFAALSDFLDESLDSAMCDKMEKHLAGCQPCEAFLSDLDRAVQRCRAYGTDCTPNYQSKLRQKVVEEYRRVLTVMKDSAGSLV